MGGEVAHSDLEESARVTDHVGVDEPHHLEPREQLVHLRRALHRQHLDRVGDGRGGLGRVAPRGDRGRGGRGGGGGGGGWGWRRRRSGGRGCRGRGGGRGV